MTALAFGHVLRIKPYSTVDFRFQNFFLGEQMEYDGASYQFVPFGFSGVTVNRTGDGLEATLVFPNNDATRAWAVSAIDDRSSKLDTSLHNIMLYLTISLALFLLKQLMMNLLIFGMWLT